MSKNLMKSKIVKLITMKELSKEKLIEIFKYIEEK